MKTRGFTLIELMITLVIGMVILAGVSSIFVSNTRVSTMLADRTERLGDLYTASHIMQQQLRSAIGAQTVVTQGLPLTIDYYSFADNGALGSFKYEQYTTATGGTDYRIMWKRPGTQTYQEMMRNMAANNGMQASITTIPINPYARYIVNVDLYANYTDTDKNTRQVSLSFKVWSRN